MLLVSKQHTVGSTKRWEIDYRRWLLNNATIINAIVVSSSQTCTVTNVQVLGPVVVFYVTGGVVNETCTVTVTMYDSAGNVRPDTLAFTVVAP